MASPLKPNMPGSSNVTCPDSAGTSTSPSTVTPSSDMVMPEPGSAGPPATSIATWKLSPLAVAWAPWVRMSAGSVRVPPPVSAEKARTQKKTRLMPTTANGRARELMLLVTSAGYPLHPNRAIDRWSCRVMMDR